VSQSAGVQKESSSRLNIYRLVDIIARFSGNTRSTLVLSVIMLAFEAGTATLIPLLIANIIDYLTLRLSQINGAPVTLPVSPLGFLGVHSFIDPDLETVAFVTLGIVIMTMINRLGTSMAEVYLARGGRRIGFNLRMFLYAHLQKLSMTFYNQSRIGDILSRLTSDVVAVEDFIISDLSDFLKSALLIIFILVTMILNDWQVAVVAGLMIPLMAVVTNYYINRIKAASQKLYNSEGELASTAQEMLTSIRVVQMYGQGSYEHSLFSAESQKSMNSALEAASYEARLNWVVNVLGAVFTVAVIWMGVYLIFRNPTGIGGIGLLIAYIRYIQDMFEPTKKLIEEWSTYSELSASLEGIGEIMDLQPAVRDEPDAITAPLFKGHLEFRSVDFAYPAIYLSNDGAQAKSHMVLKNISFDIQPGQVIAVVGFTGAGKSTIVQLIPRLYDPNAGQVLIDGHDIREYSLESLRSQISMVLQETILFAGSILENIAYGRPEATGREIIEAAKGADADEFISRLPDGYFTVLGERGLNLSDGQRQRIAMARAFIRNTPFLILDEPTTGLDAESTEQVRNALHKLMYGKTTIIISHELNLIRNADKIIVLKTGEIEQIGTHAELIKAGGLYAELYKMQSGRRKMAAYPKAKTKIVIDQTGDS
jgi:ABC-type multidrug transport system fused ATPase/permease subunit